MRREFGALDILINNAGTTKRGDFFALTDADWEEGYALKFFAHVRLARAAWPLLKERRGSLLAIGGTSGRKPHATFTIGSSVNAAVAAFTKCLADLGKEDGVQVNCIHPSLVETERQWRRIRRRDRAHRRGGGQGPRRAWRARPASRASAPWRTWPISSPSSSRARATWLHGATIDLDGGEIPVLSFGTRQVCMLREGGASSNPDAEDVSLAPIVSAVYWVRAFAGMRSMNILLTPARIGPVEIKNRIVMPPMTTRTADAEGFVTDDTVAYYMARVRGGVGLITVEMASPEKGGRHRRHEIGIYDDRFLPGLTRLVDEIHRGGAKASIQLGHGGGHTRVDICGETPIAPSAIPHPVYETTFETIVPEEMTKARIAQTTAAYVARRAARAEGRLRLRRNPRRARLSDLAIPCAVREPAHRRIRRQPGKPRALRPRRAARGEGRACPAWA